MVDVADRSIFAPFAGALFLVAKGLRPLAVQPSATGPIFEFSSEAQPAWQEYILVKTELNRFAFSEGAR
jgi:hypothetical protein